MPSTATLASRAVRRGQVIDDIRTCVSCSYQSTCNAPVPFRGPSPSRYMMLSEAPQYLEDRIGHLLFGQDAKVMGQRFVEAGLPRLDDWFVTNVICCRPPSEKVDAWAVEACQDNLRAQLDLCDPEWVLLLGATALAAVGLRGKLADVHGKWVDVPYGPFVGRKVLATYHPLAAFRDTAKAGVIAYDLSILAGLLKDGTGGLNNGFRLTAGRNGKLR